MQLQPLTAEMQSCDQPLNLPRKRRSTHYHSERPEKSRRLCDQSAPSIVVEDPSRQDSHFQQHNPLPSPSLTKSCGDRTKSSQAELTRKRKVRSPDFLPAYPSTKRPRVRTASSKSGPSIAHWLSKLPEDQGFEHPNSMSLPPPKRSRSSDSLSRTVSQSGDGTDSTVSRDRKYSAYRSINYPVVLETKGSFMRLSEAGLADEDIALCAELLSKSQPKPDSPLHNARFERFHALLRGRSDSRIYLDLHPLVVPSSENCYIGGREEFHGLVEGHNDPWVKAIPFYGPRPQPDHTFGFKWSNFTELQRKKLGIEPSEKSYYTAREDIYFPFMTSEVKCGKQGLDLADRPNVHSMTIAMRGIVDLFRKADCAADVHRRVLGFSISHDDRNARIYAHYPEINGVQTTFWRRTVKEINIGDPASTWISHQFTLNACQTFAPSLLTRLKAVIDRLPDPVVHTSEPVGVDDLSVMSSQDDPSAPESQDDGSGKPRKPGGLQAELRNMVQSLQRQLEQQRQDLLTQLDQQRKDSELQRKDSEQQRIELMQILKQQSEQIKELTRKS